MRRNAKPQSNKSGFASGPSVEGRTSYEQEVIPMVGSNFSSLASLGAQTQGLPNGMSLGSAVRFHTMIHMPVDNYNSFEAKMGELYAEIREMNAGASNYTPKDVACYILKIVNIRAWALTIMRAYNAFRATMPNSADSPYLLTVTAGVDNYSAEQATLANTFNELAVLIKDIDNLPVPPLAVLERQVTLYGGLYADSPKEKPALIGFVPDVIFDPVVTDDELVFTKKNIGAGGSTLLNKIANLRALYADIVASVKFTIIRGDLRKAFGSQAYAKPLAPLLTRPLEIRYLDGELLAQIENASFAFQNDAQMNNIALAKNGTSGIWELNIPYAAGAKVAMKAQYEEQLINYHGTRPDIAATLQITRLMPVAKWVDPLLDTKKFVVTADSGDLIYSAVMVTGVTASGDSLLALSTLTDSAQNSSVQSTAMAAMRDLAFVSSVIRGFPMIVTDEDSPRGYIWNLDNFAVVSKTELNTYHERTIRSWYNAHLPRGEMGRVERHP